jgi:hypothetical protein
VIHKRGKKEFTSPLWFVTKSSVNYVFVTHGDQRSELAPANNDSGLPPGSVSQNLWLANCCFASLARPKMPSGANAYQMSEI